MNEVREAIEDVLKQNNSLALATTGGEWSPWVLGAYFAHDESLGLCLALERSGKSLGNVEANPRVSFLISTGDAMKDFVQGTGIVSLLDDAGEARVRALLLAKMPWWKLYTPCAFARIEVSRWFVSSFSRSWFPAKTYP